METILNVLKSDNQTERKVTVIPATRGEHCTSNVDAAKKIRVAAYARVSTDYADQQTSYEMQVNYYTKYIKEHVGWQFVRVYADEGVSGLSLTKRESFNAMITDAMAGKIDLIITKSVSRFARNTVDSLTTIRTLKEYGVECYFEKENIWTLDSKGELLLTIMSSIAQEESRSISENIRWGKRKSMADGKVSVSYSKFLGYQKGENGGLAIDEAQAAVVRRIFSMFLQGYNPSHIANILTQDDVPTPSGKSLWRYHTVHRILTNEKYKGDALLQKYYVSDFLTKKLVKNNALDITNKPKESEKGSLQLNKSWSGDTLEDRPDELTFKIYRIAKSFYPEQTAAQVQQDYARLLQYSLYFYDANMCGDEVNETSALAWRHNCHTEDAKNAIAGGYHDAGDHVMFGLPQGYSATMLGWSVYEFNTTADDGEKVYDNLNQTAHYKLISDHYNDFFAQCIRTNSETGKLEVLVQKGDGDIDHKLWGKPETQQDRTEEMVWSETGADIAITEIPTAGDILAEYDIEPTTVPKEETTIVIAENGYIGIVSIPDLQLELPVMSDWSYPKLNIAPCRYKGSIAEGDIIIAAHNYWSHFGRLSELGGGEVFTFTEADGTIHTYEITEIIQLDGRDIDGMDFGSADSWDMTLFTCTLGGKSRVTVRAVEVE